MHTRSRYTLNRSKGVKMMNRIIRHYETKLRKTLDPGEKQEIQNWLHTLKMYRHTLTMALALPIPRTRRSKP